MENERGVTLVEMAIVLAIIGILAAVAVPNLSGFLAAGAQQSYSGDQGTLQTAVDAFRSDIINTSGVFPTVGALNDVATDNCENDRGTLSENEVLGDTCEAWVDIAVLVNGIDNIQGGFLASTDSVKSADPTKNTTSTSSGRYGWYINSKGRVASDPLFDGNYP